MKVLHVTTHLNMGGITNYILSLAGELKKRGAECVVASSGGNMEGEFAKDPYSFKVINVSIDLKGEKLDERRSKALLEFIKNCPVHNTLKGNPEVEIKLI